MQAPPKYRRGEPVSALLQIAAAGILVRSHQGQDYISVPNGPLTQTAFPLDSREFRGWLIDRFHAERSAAPSLHTLRTVLQTLHAKAEFGPVGEAPAGRRVLPGDDSIILDLAGPGARCIEISARGWRLQDGVTFVFERGVETGELPAPPPLAVASAQTPDTESLDHLRALLDIPDGSSWTRILAWLTAALRPEGPYPILILSGPSGSGKSTAARLLRALLDPVRTPLQPLPTTLNQMEQAATRQRILAFDDVGRLPPALLSPLAKIADRAPVILVLSADFTGDLPENIARRSLLVQLTARENQRTLFSIRREFDTLRAPVLGALCTAASTALRRFEQFAESTFPRLADVTAWTLAAAPALSLTEAAIHEAVAGLPVLPQPAVIHTFSGRAAALSAAHAYEPDPPPLPAALPLDSASTGGSTARSGLH